MSHRFDHQRAIKREQRLRNASYLGVYELVCGERVKNLTPYLLAVLSAIESPFICGGAITRQHCAQFVWAIHWNFAATGIRAWWQKRALVKRLDAITLDKQIAEISAYLDITFLDSEKGGEKEDRSIVCNTGWIVYRFHESPWNYPQEKTLHIPIRILNQELRAWTRFNTDKHVTNPSDSIISDWMAEVKRQLQLWHDTLGREGISPQRWREYQEQHFGQVNDRN